MEPEWRVIMAGGRKILNEQDCSEPEMQESWVEMQSPIPGSWTICLKCEDMVDVAVPSKVLQLGLPKLANKNTMHPHIAGSILTLKTLFVVYLQFKFNWTLYILSGKLSFNPRTLMSLNLISVALGHLRERIIMGFLIVNNQNTLRPQLKWCWTAI